MVSTPHRGLPCELQLFLDSIKATRQRSSNHQVWIHIGTSETGLQTGRLRTSWDHSTSHGSIVDPPGHFSRGPIAFHKSFIAIDRRSKKRENFRKTMENSGKIV